MWRYHVYLMSGRVLHIDAETTSQANRLAIVWHQQTDAVEVVVRQDKTRGKTARVVRVTKV